MKNTIENIEKILIKWTDIHLKLAKESIANDDLEGFERNTSGAVDYGEVLKLIQDEKYFNKMADKFLKEE